MNPPDYLSKEETAFLVQFFPMLYSLPGGYEPNTALRWCVADMLQDYPASVANPMKCFQEFQEHNKYKTQTYQGDLETDYLKFLGQVQKAAKENPIDVEFDFPLRFE